MFIEPLYKIRLFLIQLLTGRDIQVMINIRVVDGKVVLGQRMLVTRCVFIGDDDRVVDKKQIDVADLLYKEYSRLSPTKPGGIKCS